MTLEEVLVDLGTNPLSDSKMGVSIRAYLKSSIPDINLGMSADSILEKIYGLDDSEAQEHLLKKNFGVIRSSDHYRLSVLILCGFLTFITISVTIAGVDSGDVGTNQSTVLTEVIRGLIQLGTLFLQSHQ